ncbi:hypothetical protein [Paeniglutamicibacter sp.]|uniref:hypothetical protein n=1 Tax=Paeniglutamicibacter sp. TaxID=1934391 RepID=UPI003988B0F2
MPIGTLKRWLDAKRSDDYLNMTPAKARAALQKFLDERAPALQRLKELLEADGQDPAALLDGTPESLVPLWRWMMHSRFTARDAPGGTDPASVGRAAWPSWHRHTTEVEQTLSTESVALLDGLVSYLSEVVRARAPLARWEIARDSHKRYMLSNHPVLVSGTGKNHNFLPGLPVVLVVRVFHGLDEPQDDSMAEYARRLIEQLNRAEENTDETAEPEPPYEVEDVRDEEGEYDFEIGLGDEIAHERSREVDRMVRRLSREDGVEEAFREDREIILVRAPSWSLEALEEWLSRRL